MLDAIRAHAKSLGAPIYGVRGVPLRTDTYGGDSESLSLGFGTPENQLAVETSTKPLNDHLIIYLMLMTFPFDYDHFEAVVEKRVVPIEIMGEIVNFRALVLTDDWWCGTFRFGDRWIYLRGLGVSYSDVVIERIDL